LGDGASSAATCVARNGAPISLSNHRAMQDDFEYTVFFETRTGEAAT
jgi:hypothetical protein